MEEELQKDGRRASEQSEKGSRKSDKDNNFIAALQ